MISKTLGHYRILRRLGKGGMGEIYAAEDTRLKREVALKVLPPDLAGDPVRQQRFQREAEAVAALDHPNIVGIHSVETVDDVHFFTMQMVDGVTLHERIPEGGLPLDTFLDIATQTADALAAAHDRGIIHRDLKPGNIMVGENGRVRVLDFGLARLQHTDPGLVSGEETRTSSDPLTREGAVIGTVPYMSPEQVKGLPAGPPSDIFSLGSIFHEMAIGRRPFTGRTSAELMSSILRDQPVSVCEVRADFPESIGRIVERCLQKEPSHRYETAIVLHGDMERERRERSSTTTAVSAPVIDLPSRPSLAVLPFENVGGDPDQDYFALGLWADINADLVKISGLFLISQMSTGSYRGKTVSPQQVGRELGVGHILQGTVRRSGGRVRITTQLVDTGTGVPTWAERYDGQLDDLFDLQDRINEEIITALDVKLVRGESHRIIGRSLRDPQARDTYYRALAALFSFTREEIAEARRLLAAVETLEPDAPLAHAFAAFGLYFEATLGFRDSPEEALDEAMAKAGKAIELGDPTGTGYMIQGMIQLRRRQHEAAFEASEKAMCDRPSCPWVYALQGAVHNFAGRPAQAIGLARRAIRHTPLVPPVFPAVLAKAHYLLGQHPEAMEAAWSTLRLAPETLEANVVLAAALSAAGRAAEADPVVKEIYRISAGFNLDAFAQTQPYKDDATLHHMLDDLRAAGVS